jgi:hypothetical protein
VADLAVVGFDVAAVARLVDDAPAVEPVRVAAAGAPAAAGRSVGVEVAAARVGSTGWHADTRHAEAVQAAARRVAARWRAGIAATVDGPDAPGSANAHIGPDRPRRWS